MCTTIQAACVCRAYLVTAHGSVIFTRAQGHNNGKDPRVFSQESTTEVYAFRENLHYSHTTVTETIQPSWTFSRDWTNYCSKSLGPQQETVGPL